MRLIKLSFLVLIVGLSLSVCAKTNISQPQGYVVDQAEILSVGEKESLSQASYQLESKTGIQLVTVIVESLGSETVDTLATSLFEQWGIGQKGKDNGVLLLISLKDRKARIEVGYGLEGTLTDGQSGQILREVIFPYFKQKEIAKGVIAGHTYLAQFLGGKTPAATPHKKRPRSQRQLSDRSQLIILAIIIGGFFLLPRQAKRALLDLFLLSLILGGGRHRDSGGFGGFGGSGFGGFGGGSSGGGGASSSW